MSQHHFLCFFSATASPGTEGWGFSSSSAPGQKGNPSRSGGTRISGFYHTWPQTCTAFLDSNCPPVVLGSSPGSSGAATNPGPAAAASSLRLAPTAAWILNERNCTCHASSRCTLDRFYTPGAAGGETVGGETAGGETAGVKADGGEAAGEENAAEPEAAFSGSSACPASYAGPSPMAGH